MQTHIDVDFRPKLAVTPDDAIRLLVGGEAWIVGQFSRVRLPRQHGTLPAGLLRFMHDGSGPATAAPGSKRLADGDRMVRLNKAVGNRLIRPISPFQQCVGESCTTLFKDIANPYLIRDNPALTQTWAGQTRGPRSQAPTRLPPKTRPTSRRL